MILRLRHMLRARAGGKDTLAKWLIHIVSSLVLRIFFRRIEVTGNNLVPQTGAALFVLNHPSGLIDPALVFCALPRHATFLAKATLFEVPIVRALVRAWEVLPVHRRVDTGGIVVAGDNEATFEECFRILRSGQAIAIFPEGISHDAPHLLPLKTGASRIALGATADNATTVLIVPVGIFYTSKTRFRSEALIQFGEPIIVPPHAKLEPDGTASRANVNDLHSRIYDALYAVTLNVENHERLEDVRKAERLFSSIYETVTIREPLARQFERLRRFAEVNRAKEKAISEKAISPAGDLHERITEYEKDLEAFGLRPEHLSITRHSRGYVFRHVVLRIVLLTVLMPLALIGFIIHYPAFVISGFIARRYAKHGVDDILPTARILAATVLVPATWIIVAALCWYFTTLFIALIAFPVVILCGYVAMKFREEVQDLQGWYRASRLFLKNRQRFLRLLLERRKLYERLRELT
jgi:glycerol-3-phosphate O-acyltransferase / dihydroxyacetone phosphate acyltransferase